MVRTVCSIAAMIALFVDATGCGPSSRSAPAVDPLQIDAIVVRSIGGLGSPSYTLVVADDSCAYFYGGDRPPGSRFADDPRGSYVGLGSDLSYFKYLLSKNNLLSIPPNADQRRWNLDAGHEDLAIFYKGNFEPRFVYSNPDDPPQVRMVALMVDGIAFRTHWVPYAPPGSNGKIAPTLKQMLKTCPWPSRMMDAVGLPKAIPTVRP